MKFRHLSLLAGFFCLSSFSKAAPENKFQDLAAERVPFENPYLATLWGVLRIGASLDWSTKTRDLLINSSRFDNMMLEKKGVTVRVAVQSATLQRQTKIVPSPLIVVMPGFGATASGPAARYNFPKFFPRGYHVATFASPMSTDFISQRHRFPPGAFVEEAKTQLDLLKNTIKVLGPENVTEVHMIGQSYGAFIGSIMLALDSEASSQEQIFKSGKSRIALVSPPVDFLSTLEKVDQDIADTRDAMGLFCNRFMANLHIFMSALMGKNEDQISNETKVCAKGLIVHKSFKRNALVNGKTFENAFGLNLSPKDPAEYNTWSSQVSLLDAFKLYSGDSASVLDNPEMRNFNYWISLVRRNSNLDLYIFSSKDDFINRGSDWLNGAYSEFARDRLTLYDRGGHLGFVAAGEFDRPLVQLFPKVTH